MASSLSPDVIDHLFTSLPDFATLLSAISISKSFYEVFQAHPSSILTSVATTQISPELLPCAIRLAHFNRDEYIASRADYVQNFPAERMFSHSEAPTVTPHLVALIKNDSTVTELELFFSVACKDRTSGTRSLLSTRESLRFRRALYRWWLLIYLFPTYYLLPTRVARQNADDEGSDTEDDDDDDTNDDSNDDDNDGVGGPDADAPNVYQAKSQGLRKKFLSEFSDDEVAEMWQVHNFMTFVSLCTRNAMRDPPTHDFFLLWNGPATVAEVLRILPSFNEPSPSWKDHNNWDYAYLDSNWPGFFDYLEERNYDISKVGIDILNPAQDKNTILDNKTKDTEECDECHTSFWGPKLWPSSNWHLLPCVITFSEVLNALPGYLNWNSHETLPLKANPWSFTSFVNRHISSETPDWSEGKLLCKRCVLKLIGRHTLNSLREIKAQQGPQLEDCWYGYRCRTQRRHDHAAKLNHLCDPTRGD